MTTTRLRLIAFAASIPFTLAVQSAALAQEGPEVPVTTASTTTSTTTSTTVATTTAVTTTVPVPAAAPVLPMPMPMAAPPAVVVVPPPVAGSAATHYGVRVPACDRDDDDKSVPVVMSYESKPRYGMLIGGAVTFGALWMFSGIPMSLASGDAKAALPIAGPWIVASHLGHSDLDGIGKFWLAFDGLAQAAMLGLFIAGASTRHQVPVYQRMMIVPTMNSGGGGVTAVGRF